MTNLNKTVTLVDSLPIMQFKKDKFKINESKLAPGLNGNRMLVSPPNKEKGKGKEKRKRARDEQLSW